MPSNHDSTKFNEGRVTVIPVNRLRGNLCLPGDKSISHRAAMIASIAHGESALENFSTAQDCAATLDCLRALGVRVEQDGSTVTVLGRSFGLQKPAQILNAQNSGTTMRLLSGILAGQPFETTITGDDSLRSRPMLRVAEPLRLMGSEVELEPNGGAPLRIKVTAHYALWNINCESPARRSNLRCCLQDWRQTESRQSRNQHQRAITQSVC